MLALLACLAYLLVLFVLHAGLRTVSCFLSPKKGAELEEAKRSLLAFLVPLDGEETRRALVTCGAQSVSLSLPPYNTPSPACARAGGVTITMHGRSL